MTTLDFEEERKESILNNLKKWNLDCLYFSEDDFEFDGNIQENGIFKDRIGCILEYYFNQLEKAKKEIRGVFTKDEIFYMLNENISHLCSIRDNKQNFIYICCSQHFEGDLNNNPGIEFPLLDKLNKLTEMQIHALVCIFKEIRAEFDVKELFGCIDDEEKSNKNCFKDI